MNKPLRLSHPLIKIINNSLIDLPDLTWDQLTFIYSAPNKK